jgi:hypothetical protein
MGPSYLPSNERFPGIEGVARKEEAVGSLSG